MLFANVVSEIKSWENFNPQKARARLRTLLIHPMAAELLGDGPYDEGTETFITSCSDALAIRVRELDPEHFEAELGRLAAQIQALSS